VPTEQCCREDAVSADRRPNREPRSACKRTGLLPVSPSDMSLLEYLPRVASCGMDAATAGHPVRRVCGGARGAPPGRCE
jgi:hypothetical protein